MLIDKTSQKLILIVSSIVIFYSQVIIWQNYIAEKTGKHPMNFMDPQYHLQRGVEYGSEDELRKAVKLDPTNPNTHYKLANYYASYLGEVKQGRVHDEYKKAIFFADKEFRMKILEEIYSTVTQDYLLIGKILPEIASVKYALADFLMKKAKYDEAVEIFKQCIVLAEKEGAKDIKANACGNIGRIQYFKGIFDGAIESLKASLQTAPDNYWVLDIMGWAYLRKGELDEAREAFEKSITIQPRAGWAYYGLAVVYEKFNLTQKAKSYYNKASRFGLGSPEDERLIEEKVELLSQ